jgi:hypothetical protein
MLFREVASAYSENHMNPINTLCIEDAELLNVKGGDMHAHACARAHTHTHTRALKGEFLCLFL